ncbi:MAG: hypothetical protein PUE12_04185 [Oscillospiraceae bacterium]|nr:hypothetical protein [Oscillospiraceae bacterium]
MRINRRIKTINKILAKIKNHRRTFIVTAVLGIGGLCIAYGFSRVEKSVMTFVPVTEQEKPIIVIDAGHGGYVLNWVAGAIWFLTKKSSERRVCVVQSFFIFSQILL